MVADDLVGLPDDAIYQEQRDRRAQLRADRLVDADLSDARLHDDLRNVRINEGTAFGDVTPDEARATR